MLCIGLIGQLCRADDAPAIKNLLTNGGLEGEVDPATKLPAGWEVTQKPESDYKIEIVDGGRTGKKCLRILGEGKNVQIALKHLPMSPEKRSVISGWIKIVAGDGTVALSHRYESDGRPLGTVSIGGFKGPQADWMQTASIEHPEFTPPGVDATFIIGASGKVDALVDDLEVFTLDVTPNDLLYVAGDFESHYNRGLPPVYQTAISAGGKVEVSLDDKRPSNGRYCLRMKANADWATTTLYPVKYDAGKVYTLTGKVRVNSGRASLRIDYYKDDKRTDLLGSSTIDATESKDWQILTVDTRDNKQIAATHITATAICRGDAEAFFDQLVLLASEPAANQQQEAKAQATAATVDGTKKVSEKLQGKWTTVKLESAGKELKARQHALTFTAEKVLQSYMNQNNEKVTVEALVRIDAKKTPLEMDWSDMVEKTGEVAEWKEIPIKIMAIFELDGDTLKIHFRAHVEGKDFKGNPVQRPSDFNKTEPDDQGEVLMTLKRDK